MKIYNFEKDSDIKNLAFNLSKQLNNKTIPLKNSDILECLSKIHGYKDWNNFKAFIDKNKSFSFNIKELQQLYYQPSYNFYNITDIKNFSYNFRQHLHKKNIISEVEILNAISLSVGYKDWIVLSLKFEKIKEKTNIINKIINQDLSLNDSINKKYIKEPFLFFKDMFNNLIFEKGIWWEKVLLLINILLSALIQLKDFNKIKLNLEKFKEYLIIENFIELSESPYLSKENKNNLLNYLHNLPGYYKKSDLNENIREQHGYIICCIYRLLNEYINN